MMNNIYFILTLVLIGSGVPFIVEEILPKLSRKFIARMRTTKYARFFKESAGEYGYWEVKHDELPID